MDPNAKTRLSENGNGSPADPFLDRTFDGYQIEEVIGRGGMGTVYRARQLSLGRPVAIKILSRDLADKEQFLERFLREADALSRLSHPNVVQVYDRGEVDGQPYLVMEYVEGASLRDVMQEGPLPAAEALRIVSSVLAALEHAHVNGIVHRDIKPENVLLSRGRVIKVADFGLSRLLGPADLTRLTRTQLVLGTYEYMAPEQRERSKEADPRSDLYATGVVLYEMLTGELPIGRFTLPSQRRPEDCDGRFDELVERSLAKNPARRFQSASEMSGAVSVLLEHPDPVAPPRAPESRPVSSVACSPARFEYHIDNLATIDHVLGTIGYVLGFLALFGATRLVRHVWISVPFFCFFIAGWYLRNTAEGLRKYRPAARTGQAVIAILGAFTGVLLPLTVYSFWVLFSHRGRTYYEARGRGLTEQAAARHVQRVLEEPLPVPPPPPPPPAPPRAPRPSQIPVQSMLTSEVAGPPRRRRSRLVKWGWRVLFLSFVALIVMGILLPGVAPHLKAEEGVGYVFGVGMGLGLALLFLGLLHSLVSTRVTGAGSAVVGLLLFGVLGSGAAFLLTARAVPAPAPFVHGPNPHAAPLPVVRLGSYKTAPPASFEGVFFDPVRVEWLRQMTGLRNLPLLHLERRGSDVYLKLPLGVVWERNTVAWAVSVALTEALHDDFRPQLVNWVPPEELRLRLAEHPPPPFDLDALELAERGNR